MSILRSAGSKTQLTMDSFTKPQAPSSSEPAVDRTKPNARVPVSKRKTRVSQSTVLPFFKVNTRPPPQRRQVESVNIMSEAWNVGECVFNDAIKAHTAKIPELTANGNDVETPSHPPSESPAIDKASSAFKRCGARTPGSQRAQNNGNVNIGDSEDDFQSDESPSAHTPRRPERTLLNDRPSMTRRSSKRRKIRSNVIMKSAGDSNTRRRVFHTGAHSELSSETDSDRERSNDQLLKQTPGNTSNFPLPNARPEKLKYTPIVFSPNTDGIQDRSAMQFSRKNYDEKSDDAMHKDSQSEPLSADGSVASPIRRRGRKLKTLFECSDDSDIIDVGADSGTDKDVANHSNSSKAFKKRLGSSDGIIPDSFFTCSSGVNSKVLSELEPSQRRQDATNALKPKNGVSNKVRSTFIRSNSHRKRKRVALSSSSSSSEEVLVPDPSDLKSYAPAGMDGGKFCSNKALANNPRQNIHDGSGSANDLLRTPDSTGRVSPLSKLSHADDEDNATPEVFVVDSDSEQAENITDSGDLSNKGICTRQRLGTANVLEVLDLSPSPPSPPSLRKGRTKRLEVRDNSDVEEVETLARIETPRRPRSTGVSHNVNDGYVTGPIRPSESAEKGSEWYCERDIDQFSSSSSDGRDLKRTPIRKTVCQASPELHCTHSHQKLSLKQNMVDEFSDDALEKTKGLGSVGNTPTQSPKLTLAKNSYNGNGVNVDTDTKKVEILENVVGHGDIDDDDIMDLIEEEEWEKTDKSASVHPNILDDDEADDEDSPPPFYLNALCENGETVEQMIERLGEGYVLERISNAQQSGRRIIGGEQLGINDPFNRDVFSRFSKTVVAGQVGKDRAVNSVTEQALRGEYKFNYRGRSNEERGDGASSRGHGQGWGRGRGRGRGQGRGRGCGKASWKQRFSGTR